MRQSQSNLSHLPPPAQLLVFLPHPGGLPFPELPPLRRCFGQEHGLIPEAAVRQSTDCLPHCPHQPPQNNGRMGPNPSHTHLGAQVRPEGSPRGSPYLLSIFMPCSSTSRSQARCLCWASQRKRDSLCPHTSSSCWGPSAIGLPGTERERTRLLGSQGTPQCRKEGGRHRGIGVGGPPPPPKESHPSAQGHSRAFARRPPRAAAASSAHHTLTAWAGPSHPEVIPGLHQSQRAPPNPRTFIGLFARPSPRQLKRAACGPAPSGPAFWAETSRSIETGKQSGAECEPLPWQPMGRAGRGGPRSVIGYGGGAGPCLNGVPRARGRWR